MKTLKTPKKIITLYLLLHLTAQSFRTCKADLLRSFNYESRITPNRQNSLCPLVANNCCTNMDIMRMHKIWNQFTKKKLQKRYRRNITFLKQLGNFLKSKDSIEMSAYNTLFKNHTKMKIHETFIKHLTKISEEFMTKSSFYYKKLLKSFLKIDIKKFEKKMIVMRRGVLCSYCEYGNHLFMSLDSKTVTYSIKFCSAILQRFFKTVFVKYTNFFRPLLLLDEWFFLTSGKRVMENGADREKYRRYFNVLVKCEQGGGDVMECLDFCREFNLNKYTSMFDGETNVISDFISRFTMLSDDMKSDPDAFFGNDKLVALGESDFYDFKSKDSILSTRIILDPAYLKLQKTEKYKLTFKHFTSKNFFNKKHNTSPLQIETLDTELNPYILVKMLDKPVNIAKYLIVFAKKGINVAKDAKKTNFRLKRTQILALIGGRVGNHKILDEIIEQSVKDVILPITIQMRRGWVLDNRMGFSRFLYKKKFKKHFMAFKKKPLLGRLKYLVMDKIYSKWYGS